MDRKVCVITGVGPGTGEALVRQFSADYEVAMIARNEGRIGVLSSEIDNVHAYVGDLTEQSDLKTLTDSIHTDLGAPAVFIHNATGSSFNNVLDIEISELEQNFHITSTALLHFIQAFAPGMVETRAGTILAIGTTGYPQHHQGYSGFAPTRAAQRTLLDSAAHTLSSSGIHAAFVGINGVIDQDWTRKAYPEAPDEAFCDPNHIAQEVWHIVHQPQSIWSPTYMLGTSGTPALIADDG